MVAYTGVVAATANADQLLPLNLSVNVRTDRSLIALGELFEGPNDVLITGTRTHVDETKHIVARPGASAPSYYDDLYNRIHIVPKNLALGNLLSSQVRDVEVWNSYTTPVTYNSLVGINNEGIAFVEPLSTGSDIGGLESVTFEVSIVTDGPASINASYVFNFGGELLNFGITGNRVTVFPYKPDWKGGVIESFNWLTNVIRAYDGTEQTASLRSKPRRSIDHEYVLRQSEGRYAESLLWGWQARLFAIPLWVDRQSTTVDHTAGDTVVFTDTTNMSYFVGGLVILINDYRNYETVEIASIAADRVNLTLPLLNNWSTGTSVMPLNLARLPSSVSAPRKTDDLYTMKLSWSCDPIDTDVAVASAAAPATYNGYEVYTVKPNWVKDIGVDFITESSMVDFNTGGISVFERTGFPEIMHKYQWLLKNRDDIHTFKEFVDRRAGQATPFYISTFSQDMVLLDVIGSAATGMTIEDNGYALFVDVHPARQHIEIVTTTGTFYRQITSAATNGVNTLLIGLDTSLGVDVDPADVKRISYVGLHRLFSDTVKFNWKSNSVATVELNMKLVKP